MIAASWSWRFPRSDADADGISQDDFPLASLPLLGYAVNRPDPEDGITKDHVFKLQFKNHVYFFRAESEYTYSRSVNSNALAICGV